MKDHISVRTKIHNDLVNSVFKNKGGGYFSSLNGGDIKYAFDLYDKYVFGKQIRSKLAKTNSTIKFRAISDKNGGSLCGVDSDTNQYYINISPNMINRLLRLKNNVIGELSGVGKDIDRVYCFQVVLEHEIIHLLMMLWNYFDKEKTDVYSKHGKLFQCMIREYFGHTIFDYIHEIDIISYERKSPTMKAGKLVNWSNSCYLDSLLTSIFLGASSFPRYQIFTTDTSALNYGKNDFYREICHSSSKIVSKEEFYAYAKKLQDALRSDYKQLTSSSSSFKCVNLRAIISECIPIIKEGGKYVPFSPTDIYEIFARIFPGLKMRDIPTIIKTPDGDGKIKIKERLSNPIPMYQMWDYMTPIGDEGAYPIWEDSDYPILVFQSGMIPPIYDYGSMEPEIITSYGAIPGKSTYREEIDEFGNLNYIEIPEYGEITIEQYKARAFGEYIISGRYRLFAAVRSEGIAPSVGNVEFEGGGHYTAYIRPSFDNENWYLYDDIGPTWKMAPEGKLPENTFLNTEYSRSEILFYQKIKAFSKM